MNTLFCCMAIFDYFVLMKFRVTKTFCNRCDVLQWVAFYRSIFSHLHNLHSLCHSHTLKIQPFSKTIVWWVFAVDSLISNFLSLSFACLARSLARSLNLNSLFNNIENPGTSSDSWWQVMTNLDEKNRIFVEYVNDS